MDARGPCPCCFFLSSRVTRGLVRDRGERVEGDLEPSGQADKAWHVCKDGRKRRRTIVRENARWHGTHLRSPRRKLLQCVYCIEDRVLDRSDRGVRAVERGGGMGSTIRGGRGAVGQMIGRKADGPDDGLQS